MDSILLLHYNYKSLIRLSREQISVKVGRTEGSVVTHSLISNASGRGVPSGIVGRNPSCTTAYITSIFQPITAISRYLLRKHINVCIGSISALHLRQYNSKTIDIRCLWEMILTDHFRSHVRYFPWVSRSFQNYLEFQPNWYWWSWETSLWKFQNQQFCIGTSYQSIDSSSSNL